MKTSVSETYFRKKKSTEELNLIQRQKHYLKWLLATLQGGYNLENIDYQLSNIVKDELWQSQTELNKKTHNIIKGRVMMQGVWKTLDNILQTIKKRRKLSFWFLQPVNINKVPDYSKRVKHPMDLGKVGQKIKKRSYKNPLEFRNDLRLIWENCRRYNQIGTAVQVSGEKLSEYFEKRWQRTEIEEQFSEGIAKHFAGMV